MAEMKEGSAVEEAQQTEWRKNNRKISVRETSDVL